MTTHLLWHLLRDSAACHPDAIAVSGPGGSLTYAALDDRSARLATLLAEAGVVRGTRVGFMLSKSVASVVTIFAILRAGGVYVPIDPASPPRIQNIASDQLRPHAGISGRTDSVGTVWFITVHPHGRLE